MAKNKSEAIRKLLTAVPDIRAKHAREMLAEEGIDISLDLFRVVRSAWRKDRRELEAAERRYKLKAPPPLSPDDNPRILDPTYPDHISKTPDPAPPERDHIPQPPPPLRTDDIPDLSAPEAALDENDSAPTDDDATCDFRFHDRIIDSFSDGEWTAILSRHNQAQDEDSLKHEIAFWGYFLGLTQEESIARLGRRSEELPRGEEQPRPTADGIREQDREISDGSSSLLPMTDDGQSPLSSFRRGRLKKSAQPGHSISEQFDELVAKVRRAFSDEDWEEIVAEYRKPGLAESCMAEEISEHCVGGSTPEEAVARVIADHRDRGTAADDDEAQRKRDRFFADPEWRSENCYPEDLQEKEKKKS